MFLAVKWYYFPTCNVNNTPQHDERLHPNADTQVLFTAIVHFIIENAIFELMEPGQQTVNENKKSIVHTICGTVYDICSLWCFDSLVFTQISV